MAEGSIWKDQTPIARGTDILRQWQKQGFARIRSELPLLFNTIERGFLLLLADKNERCKWKIQDPFETDLLDSDHEIDIGLLDRRGKISHDNKEVLHFAPRLTGQIMQQGANVYKYKEFLRALELLYQQSEELSVELAGDCHMLERMLRAKFWNKVRVISYAGDGEFHTDRNGWTVSIKSSQSDDHQLWLRNREGRLIQAREWNPGEIIVFPGDKFAMPPNGWDIEPMIHGVVGKAGSYRRVLQTPARPRVSVQFFCHLEVTEEEWTAGRKRLAFIKDKEFLNNLHQQIPRTHTVR
jgi:hypothetical protein